MYMLAEKFTTFVSSVIEKGVNGFDHLPLGNMYRDYVSHLFCFRVNGGKRRISLLDLYFLSINNTLILNVYI